MQDTAGVVVAKLNNGAGEIGGVSRGAALVFNDIDLLPVCRKFEDGIRETFSADAKEPGGAHDAATGENLEDLHFRIGFGPAIYAARRARVIGLVRCRTQPIKYIIRAQKQQPRPVFLGGSRDIHCTLAIHSERQFTIAFAAVDIGVRSREDDPVRTGTPDRSGYLVGITDVRTFRAECGNLILLPLLHQRLAEHAGSAENGNAHS